MRPKPPVTRYPVWAGPSAPAAGGSSTVMSLPGGPAVTSGTVWV